MNTGDLSTLLVWGAMTALTIALVAYAVDLAAIAERAQRRVPAKASAGAGGGTTTAVATPPGGTSAVGDGRSLRAEGIARTTTYVGIVLLLGAVVTRGLAAGRWPTANMYEFTVVGVLVATTVLAIVQRRRVIAFVGVLVLGIAVLALALGLLVFFVQADAVQPALQSYWLVLHVGVAITATGVFTVAFAASVLQVLQDVREVGPRPADEAARRTDGLRRWVTGPRFGWLQQVPSARELEAQAFRLNAIGFVLWTFTLIGGAIWAEHAWGRYWGWDPKEVGTFVAWVVYAAYLHARTTRGWSGRKAAYFVFVGYAVVLANFSVVNLFVTGKHSYSGL
ncbi:c-type cytochrome biogenesis protein CcsB [Cellulomonas chitinilytica]|uniref:C-type cytochrome biogenesis protein CcsB n=1 Tax=Cellulomonas chitinilytica TaxID=398759 RepID=A0A919P751_9CELL|nr:c-type cytochrome biogenesis protein CcsB [Cellulomonas chitinilytica]GIG22199.1 c-type cytochrome biogenesis protein CcsB [Cellulomonas chitinilytica]